jgi:DNA replication protein DnaC
MEKNRESIEIKETQETEALLNFTQSIESIACKWLQRCGVPERYINADSTDIKGHEDHINVMDSFYITGAVGSGKTHMAVAIMKHYICGREIYYDDKQKVYRFKIDKDPIFVVVPELLLHIRSCFDSNTKDVEREVIEKYASTPFLILDDLGTEKTTDWALQTLFIIINRRYNAELPTVITSNLALALLADILGERIASRINGMCLYVELDGKDRR